MIKSVEISNYGSISKVSLDSLSNINLIIGESGKTTMLKAIYSAVKTTEQYKRGAENKTCRQILSSKLHWGFMCMHLSDIVKKGESKLSYRMTSDKDEVLSFSFTSSAYRYTNVVKNTFAPTNTNSIFIPAKEILSLKDFIISSRVDMKFAFEDTYYDLAIALTPISVAKNSDVFLQAQQIIEKTINGKIYYDRKYNNWMFKDSNHRVYDIAVVSESVRRISTLSILLGNNYLSNNSIIFIDEIEANLHPNMIINLMNVILLLSQAGIQFFISTNSYLVTHGFYTIAHKNNMSIPIIKLGDKECVYEDLLNDIPKDDIVSWYCKKEL